MPPAINQTLTPLIGIEYNGSFQTQVSPKYYTTSIIEKIFRYGKGGHYGYPNFGMSNVGGPMYLESHIVDRAVIPVGTIWRGGALGQYYTGSVVAHVDPRGLLSGNYYPDDWGASAYSKMKPAQPSFQALNAIYELKDLPGMLRQRLTHNNLHNVSNYWLALQFGWKPLLNDIRNMVRSQMNGQERLKQLLRDNGRPVRRKILMFDTISGEYEAIVQSYSTIQPVFVTQYYDSAPKLRERSYDQDRVWASARFRYWLPPGPQDVQWRARMMARIFGLNPSPSVVYNAIPWSWLIDWYTNVGDVLENLDSGVADRLAADYFYVMRERSYHRIRYSDTAFHTQEGVIVKASGTSTAISSVKTRAVGDPFGFATNANSLSGMQLSILGALGMSRLK